MANYTMTLYNLIENPLTPIFNFDYPFYCDSVQAKKNFEQKFINHYFFHEIGAETFARWEQMLKAKLLVRMPYYTQLYQTELESKGINFLLNKDLVEEFTRELVGNRQDTGSSESMVSGSASSNGETNNKVSNINDGVSSASLSSDYLTGVGQDKHSTHTQTNSSGTAKSKSNTDNNERETTRLISQGNIGTTSSAELLEKWRNVLINIDEMIINECRDLFMTIY